MRQEKKPKTRFGESIVLPPYRGCLNPEYASSRFLETASQGPALFESEDMVLLHQGRNRVAGMAVPLSSGSVLEIVVKEFKPRGVDRLKSLILPSKICKAWRGSWRLKEKGIETPRPMLYLEKRRRGFVTLGYFFSSWVKPVREVRHLFRTLAEEEMLPWLRGLAAYISDSHRKGMLHRDLSDGNILCKREPGKAPRFYLIDTNRIKQKRKVNPWQGIRALIRLGVPEDRQREFLAFYLGRPSPPRHYWIWYQSLKRSFSGWIRLKKILKLKKIAEKLRIQ